MADTIVLSTRIERRVKNVVSRWCKENGISLSYFIQEALLDRLEEHQDKIELGKLRTEPKKSLDKILAELKLS